jgi:hypothetical protein
MTMTTAEVADSLAQLASARQLVAERCDIDEPLTHAALMLIDCAVGVVSQLPGGDLGAATEALGSARAAVVCATYAVRRAYDLSAGERS